MSEENYPSYDKCEMCCGTGRIYKEKKEEPNICMICFDNVVDTMVTPCMHTVVCRICSDKLKETSDKRVCVRCRCPITGIFFKDNTMEQP